MSVRDDEFVAFVEAYRPRLERTARLLTAGDEGGAEDLVQITLTKVYVNWRTVAGVDSPIAYAHRILSNAAIDKRRSAFSRRELRTAEPREYAPATAGVDRAVTDRHLVLSALAKLPVRQRAVIVLRYWLDHSVDDTAAMLDIATGTVKSQAAKGLATLRTELATTWVAEGARHE